MGQKLNLADSELYQRTDEVLHYVWGSIGVAAVPMARDEYHGYLPHETPDKIAAFLGKVAIETMGLNGNFRRATEIASLLLGWKTLIARRHSFLRDEPRQ